MTVDNPHAVTDETIAEWGDKRSGLQQEQDLPQGSAGGNGGNGRIGVAAIEKADERNPHFAPGVLTSSSRWKHGKSNTAAMPLR